MELSLDLPNLEQPQFNAPVSERMSTKSYTACRPVFADDPLDIIDVSELNFSDDETWLVKPKLLSEPDLRKWLYNNSDDSEDLFAADLNLEQKFNQLPDLKKNIDTRTFTRPKKRLTRPSIEKYNEELYGSDSNNKDFLLLNSSGNKFTDSGIQSNGGSLEDTPVYVKPLHFDLAEPSTSFYFESILANNNSMIDSFQNMSPPSLVNSMCSSTFANLMENSLIKNDPVLREIRDTDYTGVVLLQDTEPIMAESCSSVNSDVPEQFLKNASLSNNETYNKKSFVKLRDSTEVLHDATYNKNNGLKTASVDDVEIDLDLTGNETITSENQNFNATYQRKLRPAATFRVADINNGSIKMNSTYQRQRSSISPQQNRNATITLKPENEIITTKRLLDRRPSPSMDLNRLSYEDKKDCHNQTYPPHENYNLKRNSYGSTDSTENLDYMSLSSGSSKSSNKILSMDGINAIVEMQEKSLRQIMSTPKNSAVQFLWKEGDDLSPIGGRNNSDPELSSSELCIKKSQPIINPSTIKKQKSLGNINATNEQKIQHSISRLQAMGNHIRTSHPNLKIQSTNVNNKQTLGSRTNLKSMGHTLKGSYTSLKPMNTNLPVAPPLLDSTVTVTKEANATHIVTKVKPLSRDVPRSQDAQFVKPQLPRTSGLPRPMSAATGIPRPASRIPGPRSLRTPSVKSAAQQGRH